ncbi:MAG TPA: RNA 2'-phosphotransferase, partial [Kofleriaceae bacterium]|nr:RNA 2'-phosphotransferase [Kofleriaceae bacterium]
MSVRVSKFLSLVLRHDPARIGITLDDAGWTDVDALLTAASAHGVLLTRDELREIVASSDKQRFALSPDGARIRANQGHSVPVDLQLAACEPPALLYHGTVEAALPGIREEGLVRGARHHVHLSADVETATKVGRRRGAPVILTIRAADMHAAGHAFYRSENGVWLVDRVPARFLLFKGPKGSGTVSRGAKTQIAKQTLEACDTGAYTSAAGEAVPIGEAIDAAKRGTMLHELGRGAAREPAARGDRARSATAVTGETTIEA